MLSLDRKLGLLWVGLSFVAGGVSASEGGSHGGEHKHIVGVFIGATKSDHATDATFGLEYEYKLTHQFGVGAVYEILPDGHNGEGISITLAAGYWHPYAGWRVGVGIGQETVQGAHSVSHTLTRVTAAYDFHVMGFGVAPTISFDSVDGASSQAYGVAIGKSF